MGDLEVAHDRILWRSGEMLRRTEQQYFAGSFPGAFQTGKRALGDAAVMVTISAAATMTSFRIAFLSVVFCVAGRLLACPTLSR